MSFDGWSQMEFEQEIFRLRIELEYLQDKSVMDEGQIHDMYKRIAQANCERDEMRAQNLVTLDGIREILRQDEMAAAWHDLAGLLFTDPKSPGQPPLDRLAALEQVLDAALFIKATWDREYDGSSDTARGCLGCMEDPIAELEKALAAVPKEASNAG